MPRVQRARAFKWPGKIIFSVFLSVVGWVLLVAALAVLAKLLITQDRGYGIYFLAAFGGYIFVRLAGFIYAMRVRCPLCHGPPLHQKRCHMHRDARKFGFLSYRVSTILDILGDGVFTCMYCGTPFRLKK
jgi:hypothetical protein